MGSTAAHAQGLSVSAVSGAVTSSPLGLRPGVRIAYEPSPGAALEAIGWPMSTNIIYTVLYEAPKTRFPESSRRPQALF